MFKKKPQTPELPSTIDMAPCPEAGDILLCAGQGSLSKRIAKFQKFFTRASQQEAAVTHAARVFGGTSSYALMVMESTTLNTIDGEARRGVQINPFLRWLAAYNGQVYLKKLSFERTVLYHIKENAFWTEHKDRPYENGIPGAMELFLCGLQFNTTIKHFFPDWKPRPTTEPHCTELVGANLEYHNHLTDQFFREHSLNRLPPWFWVHRIDKYLTPPVSPLIRLK